MEVGVEPGDGMKVVAGPVVQIDEGRIQAHLDEVVRATVEETLNALLDAAQQTVFTIFPGVGNSGARAHCLYVTCNIFSLFPKLSS